MPNIFSEGLYLPALQDKRIQFTFTTADARDTGAGAGSYTGILATVANPNINLVILATQINDVSDQQALFDYYSDLAFRSFQCLLNEPATTSALPSSGIISVPVKQESLADQVAVKMLGWIHSAARTQPFTTVSNDNFFRHIRLPAWNTKIYLQGPNGVKIFCSNTEFQDFQKAIRHVKESRDNSFLTKQPWLYWNFTGNGVKDELQDTISGAYKFTGLEYLVAEDTGVTTAVYMDTMIWSPRYFQMVAGTLGKMEGI